MGHGIRRKNLNYAKQKSLRQSRKYVTEAKMDISDTVIENLSIHLALSITRELSGSYIEMSSSQIEQLKQANTYQIHS